MQEPEATPAIKNVTRTTSLKGVIDGSALVNQALAKPEPPKVEENEPTAPVRNSPFTQEELTATWNSFATKIEKDKPRIYSLMQSFQPIQRENFEVFVAFDGQVQIDMFQEVNQELIIYLKTELNNTNININYEVGVQGESTKNSLYTSGDKLKFMLEQNPELLRLTQQLSLDLI